jgi:hypothetical protein
MSDSGIVVEGNANGEETKGGEESTEGTEGAGEETTGNPGAAAVEKEIGVYEAVFDKLFAAIAQKDLDQRFVQSKNVKSTSTKEKEESTVAVTMQVLEVYNEVLYDLSVAPEVKPDGKCSIAVCCCCCCFTWTDRFQICSCCGCGVVVLVVDVGTLEHWNIGTLEHWNIGTLEHWNIQVRWIENKWTLNKVDAREERTCRTRSMFRYRRAKRRRRCFAMG